MRSSVRRAYYLGHIFSLLGLGLLRWRRHWPPRSISEPIAGHILCAVHLKQPTRHSSVLEYVLRTRLHRQRLRPGQVKPSGLVLFAVENRYRDDSARRRLAAGAGPFQNSHRTHRGCRLLGVLDTPGILRQSRCHHAKSNRQHPRSGTRQRGIISSGCILNLLEGLSHASERQSGRLYSPDR